MFWEREWGGKGKLALLLKAKAKGMDPIALRNRPKLPWYYLKLYNHFATLSRGRSHYMGVSLDKSGNGVQTEKSNPIDTGTILQYNKEVAKLENAADFLDLMRSFDDIHLGLVVDKET